MQRVSITTLVDNSLDLLAVDVGPAHRPPLAVFPRRPAGLLEEGSVPDGPLAEHGFSALVEVELADGAVHRLLFDTGISPDGMVENMRRLQLSPTDAEVVVCSHGHFDHTTGLEGLARRIGRVNLPVVIHPEFWSHRRLMLPGRDPFVMPTASRGALEGAGFDIIESTQTVVPVPGQCADHR